MLEKLFLLVLIVFSFIAVQSDKLRRAVIYLGVFSLISSFAFIFYGAADVAMAEAVIGSTIATILLLIALKKYKVFTICIVNASDKEFNDKYINNRKAQFLNDIENFLIEKEFEPQTVYTNNDIKDVIDLNAYDLVIDETDDNITIYGNKQNYQLDDLYTFLSHSKYKALKWTIIRVKDVMESDA